MMTSVIDRSAPRTVPTSRGRLPTGATFALLVSILVVLLASSSAPTPLYPIYQAQWGYSAITTTVVFGVYAIAVLTALLTAGSLSDYIGRRPVLLLALPAQAVVMLVFATADGAPQLITARVLQGLATGAAIGAVGAGLLDLNRNRGTIANAVAPMFGTGFGALVGGLFVQFLPAPSQLVFVVLSGVLLLQTLGVALMPETTTGQPGAFASLRPEIALPPAARAPMLVATPVLVAAWALGGFYLALGPALARVVVHSGSILIGGVMVFVMAFSAAVTVLLARNVAATRMMVGGIVGLIVGVAISLVAITAGSPVAFAVSLILAGAGFGTTLQGAIRTVLPAANEHQRAGLLSLVYVVSYLGMGLPAIIGGVLVVYGGGLRATAVEYGIAVIALASLALVALRRTTRRTTRRPAPVAP